ncbi:RNI-like protein [Backusella circina FSU 941]|nr:RNI-like protein [Backusella circina FSU 941]
MSSSNSQQNNNQQNNNHQRPNVVRGPTSALSSFLREQGIRVPNQGRRARRERDAAAAASSSQATTTQASASSSQVSTEAPAQEQLTEVTPSSPPRISLRLGNRSRLASASAKATKKRKKINDSDSDSDDTDDDDLFQPSSSSSSKPKPRVSVVFCATCHRRFTRKSTQTDMDECPTCLSGESSSAKPSVKRKKVITRMSKNIEGTYKVPSLQDICIGVIASHIEDVESLGFISEDSLGKLSRIISKNRKMSNEIARLFMEPTNRRLQLYDCTDMSDTALLNIAHFCPKLQDLHLSYCGRMTDTVIQGYGTRLPELKSLHFSGPYLVTKPVWMHYFEQLGKRMESFELRYTSRFDLECLQTLVQCCPNLTNLKLGHITAMDSSWLETIASLTKLTSLEMAWPEGEIKTEEVVQFLVQRGPYLRHLSLKGGVRLDDKTFVGLHHCKRLETLSIEQATDLTAKGMVDFLKAWQNPGLRELDVARCTLFDDEVLTEVIQHSGASLTKLNIHSLDNLTITGLEPLVGCKELRVINCSFVRSMDDFILGKLVKECVELNKVEVWGCPMLTDAVMSNERVIISGRELLDIPV